MDEKRCVIWLDPGAVTGMAWWDPGTEVFGSWQYEPGDLYKRIDYLTERYEGRIDLGYENFLIAGRGFGNPKPSMEVIGELKKGAAEGRYRLLKPMPSSARKLGNVVLLRRLGWYKPGKDDANDASMHLLAYLLRERLLPPSLKKKALHTEA